MRKLTLTAAVFVLGILTITANAQTQAPGAASFHAQVQNATSIVKQAACRGTGAHCPPGYVWNGYRCRPCY
jgi:hypothetical protein